MKSSEELTETLYRIRNRMFSEIEHSNLTLKELEKSSETLSKSIEENRVK